jgi:dienelactone hydrolase
MARKLLLLTLLVLVACAPASAALPGPPPPLGAAGERWAQPGPEQTTVSTGSLRSTAGCALEYELWRPDEGTGVGVVILAHGFLRDLRSMRGWAEHFASHGFQAIAVSLCQSTPFDGRHAGNAADLRVLLDTLAPDHPGPRVYAGFSAGGLAALLAAHADPRASAVLALDPVDSGGLLAALPPTGLPGLVLFAEPSSCNADSNAEAPLSAWPALVSERIANATHCHFENPSSRACEWLCGRVTPRAASEAIETQIRARAGAWLLQLPEGSVGF